jgi:hypothetical protein
MQPIDRIRQRLLNRDVRTVRVLLVFGGPLGHALGDTIIATNHYRFLKAALTNVRLTVWTADKETWHSICGDEVQCHPFLSERKIRSGFDLIILDWVSFDKNIENLFTGHSAHVISIPPGENGLRYRPPIGRVISMDLPPRVSHTRRLHQVYEALGVSATSGESSTYLDQNRAKIAALYLNPYASSAEKCLDESLLRVLLCQLPTVFHDGRVLCPSIPLTVPVSDRKYYARLDTLIREAAQTGKVQRLDPMSRKAFISTVTSCSVVIGPDTSTQHIASLYGIPSIACYPHGSGFRYYRWGSPGRSSLCFQVPAARDKKGAANLGDLISHLVNKINNAHPEKRGNPKVALDFVQLCTAIAARQIRVDEGRRQVSKVLRRIRNGIRRPWRRFVLPELGQICREICERAKHSTGSPDEVSLTLLSDVYALKTLTILDGAEQGKEPRRIHAKRTHRR